MQIENKELCVKINPKGGALCSVFDKKRNQELLYQPIENSWQGQDVIIFPFVARLKDGIYQYKGSTYSRKNHGLIRYREGKENKTNSCEGNIEFHSDEETRKQYPFDFTLTVNYRLRGKRLAISRTVTNLSDEPRPYRMGAHPAFRLPGKKTETEFDISGNSIFFPKNRKLTRITMDKDYHFVTGEEFFGKGNRIPLSKALFRHYPTLIFQAFNIPYVDLKKSDGSLLRVHKDGISYLALWSDEKWGNYVAIEPWAGLPDYADADKDITKKKTIHRLEPGHVDNSFIISIEID